MSRALELVLVAALAACVPSASDPDPSGGAAITFEPSPATKGTPFVTQDGWTVTIAEFAILAQASDVTTLDFPDGEHIGGGGPGPTRVLVPGAPGCELRISGAKAGAEASFSVALAGRDLENVQGTPLPPCGVTAKMEARFDAVAENETLEDGIVPNFLLVAHAVKEGRTITIDMAVLADANSDFVREPSATIVANAGAPVRFPIYAESAFLPADASNGVTMDVIAATDANEDGVVTAQELASAIAPCVPPTPPPASGDDDDSGVSPFRCPSVLDVIAGPNLGQLFGLGQSP